MGYTSDFFKKKRDESETTTQSTESFGAGSFVFDPHSSNFSDEMSSAPAAPRSEAPKFNPGIPNSLSFDALPGKEYLKEAAYQAALPSEPSEISGAGSTIPTQ